MLGHLGAISLKNLTKRKEVRKGADQANGVVEMKRVAFNHILLKNPVFSTILSRAIRSKKKAMLSAILFVLLITRADIQLFSFLNYKEFAHQIPNAAK